MGGVCSGGRGNENENVEKIASNFPRKLILIPYAKKQAKEASSISKADGRKAALPENFHSGRFVLSKATTNKKHSSVEVDVEAEMDAGENKIGILAFEVASTIAKGLKLSQSLSGPNIQILKNQTFLLKGVQSLVSTDMEELTSIVSSDKRQELDVFVREVIRFGKQCKDPKWHNLDKSFLRPDSCWFTGEKESTMEAETTMQELTTLAQHTNELYNELIVLGRFEQEFRRKLEEVESSNLTSTRASLGIFQYELNIQRRHVTSLKNKSLWSRNMDEIVEQLVKIVPRIHQSLAKAFVKEGRTLVCGIRQRLGSEGLALHYANIITQINAIASRPMILPLSTRNSLFNALPATVRTALRCKIECLRGEEELTVCKVKNEMKKTLQWLLPMASNTIKVNQTLGRTGRGESNNSKSTANVVLLQTLYHANKQKTEQYILELVALLHCLISLVRHQTHHFKPFRGRSPTPVTLASQSNTGKHRQVQAIA